MPIDTSMYASLPQPNGVQNLATMAGVANTLQQNQVLRSQAYQQNIDAQEMQAVRPFLANSENYTDANGNVDFNKLVPAVMQAAPKNGSGIISNIAVAQKQKTDYQNALQTQSNDQLLRTSDAIASLDPDKVTPQDLAQMRDAINKNLTTPQAIQANNNLFAQAIQGAQTLPVGDPRRAQGLQRLSMMYRPLPQQQEINTPYAAKIDNGQSSALINLKPNIAGLPQGAIVPGSYQRQEAPPTTPQIGPDNTPGILGAQGPAGSLSQGQKGGFIPTQLPTGTEDNIHDNFKEMNRHFASLQDQATGNQLVQSLRGNIQSLAQKAITGTTADKLAYYNGLLAALPGHGHADDIKTATDLLDKNMAQLNLSTPASTDAARSLITLSRPHGTMTAEAIKEATDQVASQVEANMAIRNHLSGYKYANGGQGNATAYQAERQNVENVADPRIWQYMHYGKGTPEAQAFLKKMSASDMDIKNKNGFVYKINEAARMGLINGGQ